MWQRALSVGGGGASEFTFQFMPIRVTGGNDALTIPTSAISHFKSVISPSSAYSHSTGIVVGYTNTFPVSYSSPSVTSPVELNVADFDVDTSYTYVVIAITSGQPAGRTYDITLTLK